MIPRFSANARRASAANALDKGNRRRSVPEVLQQMSEIMWVPNCCALVSSLGLSSALNHSPFSSALRE